VRFDRIAALLTAGLFSLFVLGLGEIAHAGLSLSVAAEWVGAAICGIILFRRQAGHAAPMIATDLLRRPLFALSAVASVCAFAAQGLAFVSLPFLLQHGLGHSQVETGFLMTPWPVDVAGMAPLAGYFSDHYGPGLLGSIGLAALCAGLVLLATLPSSPSVIGIVWRMAVCEAGFGFFQAPNVRAFMTSAPPTRSGSASGMASLVRLLGQTTGAALVAGCFAYANANGPHAGTVSRKYVCRRSGCR
jgi:DHA2 family multidrug resistance protein-like MFS transporter